MLKANKMATDKSNNFIYESDYEDDYSRNEIQNIQSKFERECNFIRSSLS